MQWIQSQSNRYAAEPARLVFGLILLLAGLPAAASWAQSAAQGTAQVNVARANFRATCSLGADVVASLTEGEEIEILESVGDWYRVRHPESGVEGCMHRTVLGPVTAISAEEAEALAEREQELREREAEAREAELEAERERREAELETREEEAERRAREAEWAARRARGEKRVTGYFDLNPVGYGLPGDDRLHYEGALILRTDPPTPIPNSHFETDFEYDGDLTYGLAGGVLVALQRGGSIGGGVSVTRATYAADLRLQLSQPHPTVPVIVGDSFMTKAPDRTETAFHLHAVYAPPTSERMRVRVFLGPTAFRIELPVWAGAIFRFPPGPPRMEIESVEFPTRDETVVGAHVGADIAFFFSKVFGIGASALYSRGTEEFQFQGPAAGLDAIEEEVTLGGLSALLGVRFRF